MNSRIKMEWNQAVAQVDILISNCNWSKTIFVFMKASLLYMKMIDENKPEMKPEISELFKFVHFFLYLGDLLY